MSCKVCDFFEKSKETKEKIEAVNNTILRECKYKDIAALLGVFRNDTKLTIPSSHFINKHKDNCLNGVKLPPVEDSKTTTVNNTGSLNKPDVPDSFKQKNTLERIVDIQEIMFEVLYKQAHLLNNSHNKVAKSDVDSIKSLIDIALCNYLDLSEIEISSDKKLLDKSSIEMLNTVLKSSLVNNNDVLDVVKLLFKADFQQKNIYTDMFDNVEEQLEEMKTTKDYLEYKTNNI